ncbi:hypothetical protein [Streptomyces sp. NBC_01615]|uniref:DUF4760 domain-containing protein n=1 Tax=Streptomyces sp. NBC_01615 TaxID=2975898 RepID=UPI00386F5455
MDGSLMLNLLALGVSVTALATSIAMSRGQLRLAHNSNVLPIIIDMFKETRSPDFLRSVEYIRTELGPQHPHRDGYRNLPPEPREHIRRVGQFYDDVGKLVAHGVVDEHLVLGSYSVNVQRMWEALSPYIYNERARHGTLTMTYFEDLAARAKQTPGPAIHSALDLRRLPPA